MVRASGLPWRKPRHELLLLALVAVVALSPVYDVSAQDLARLCLTQALVSGHLYNDTCFGLDRSEYKGHIYSDKAPGLSLLELPTAEVLRLSPTRLRGDAPWQLWVVRLLSAGVAFVACAFLIGRLSEGLAPGFGAISLVAFALGTPMALFAAANFDQVPCAALGFGAFVLAWRGQPLLAGLLAGTAVVVEYQAALILGIVAVYVALAGRRPLARYIVGVLPGAALLGAYDWLAFGAPWRLSYRYVANVFTEEQTTGFFGIGLPHLRSSYDFFAGSGGLLVASPVLVAAAWGLVELRREYPREAAVCGAVTVLFVIVNCGYFLPYGGSPAPRFLIPSLPFLALGLGLAFARHPRLTGILAAISVATTTARMLVWSDDFRGSVWGQLARVPGQLGSSRFAQHLERTPLDWAGAGRAWGAVAVALCAVAALAVAFRAVPRDASRTRQEQRPSGRRRITGVREGVAVASVCLVVAANASLVSGYPYGHAITELSTSIQGSSTTALLAEEVDFVVTVSNSSRVGYADVVIKIELAPRMRLLGRPAYERGSGCQGTAKLTCRVGDLSRRTSTPVRLGVLVTQLGDQTLTATALASGVPSSPSTSYTVEAVRFK